MVGQPWLPPEPTRWLCPVNSPPYLSPALWSQEMALDGQGETCVAAHGCGRGLPGAPGARLAAGLTTDLATRQAR